MFNVILLVSHIQFLFFDSNYGVGMVPDVQIFMLNHTNQSWTKVKGFKQWSVLYALSWCLSHIQHNRALYFCSSNTIHFHFCCCFNIDFCSFLFLIYVRVSVPCHILLNSHFALSMKPKQNVWEARTSAIAISVPQFQRHCIGETEIWNTTDGISVIFEGWYASMLKQNRSVNASSPWNENHLFVICSTYVDFHVIHLVSFGLNAQAWMPDIISSSNTIWWWFSNFGVLSFK